MKSLRDLLFADENKAAIDEISRTFDLDETSARAAVDELIPALSRGMRRNTETGRGMDELLEALRTGEHAKYVERPGTLSSPGAKEEGDGILGHLFGSKEVSREVARRASERTGVSDSVLRRMLPMLAAAAMGALSKGVLGGGLVGAVGGAVGGALGHAFGDGAKAAPPKADRAGAGGLIGSLLDADRDGSVWDDVLGLAVRGLRR